MHTASTSFSVVGGIVSEADPKLTGDLAPLVCIGVAVPRGLVWLVGVVPVTVALLLYNSLHFI
jgi:hypothetical protein